MTAQKNVHQGILERLSLGHLGRRVLKRLTGPPELVKRLKEQSLVLERMASGAGGILVFLP